LRLQLNQAAQRCISNDFCPTDELPDWLIYRQRCDFFISGDEAVINGNQASIDVPGTSIATITSALSSLKVTGLNWNLYFSIVLVNQSSILSFQCQREKA